LWTSTIKHAQSRPSTNTVLCADAKRDLHGAKHHSKITGVIRVLLGMRQKLPPLLPYSKRNISSEEELLIAVTILMPCSTRTISSRTLPPYRPVCPKMTSPPAMKMSGLVEEKLRTEQRHEAFAESLLTCKNSCVMKTSK